MAELDELLQELFLGFCPVVSVSRGVRANTRMLSFRARPIGRHAHQCISRKLPHRRQLKSLEPISKSFEEDHELGELDEAEEVLAVVLPADEDAALPLDPGEEAFDEPTSHVTA